MDDCLEVIAPILLVAGIGASGMAVAEADTVALQPTVGTGTSKVPLAAVDTVALQPAVKLGRAECR